MWDDDTIRSVTYTEWETRNGFVSHDVNIMVTERVVVSCVCLSVGEGSCNCMCVCLSVCLSVGGGSCNCMCVCVCVSVCRRRDVQLYVCLSVCRRKVVLTSTAHLWRELR